MSGSSSNRMLAFGRIGMPREEKPNRLFQNGFRNFFNNLTLHLDAIYSIEKDLLFRARNLVFIITTAMSALALLLVIFLIMPLSIMDANAKTYFTPAIASLLVIFVLCLKLVISSQFSRSRAIVFYTAVVAVFTSIMVTGGFPFSIASPAVFIPVTLSYCLYGGKRSHIFAILTPIILGLQWIICSAFDITLPDLSSGVQRDINMVVALFTTYMISVFALLNFDHSTDKYIRQANAALISKNNFLANTSHEIRTPMNGIIGLTEVMLKATKLNEQQTTYMGAIHHSANALMNVINDILDYSKLEAGGIKLFKREFNLYGLMSDIRSLLNFNAEEKNVDLVLFYPKNKPNRFIGDAGRLRQILINLVGNALKFTQEGSVKIIVDIDAPNNPDDKTSVNIHIQDTGIGISKDKLSMIFHRFSQVETGHTQKYGGTGLGLSISRKLAELMDGEIVVKSEVDKGSTFSLKLKLPLAQALDIVEPEQKISKTPQAGNKATEITFSSASTTEEVSVNNVTVTKSIDTDQTSNQSARIQSTAHPDNKTANIKITAQPANPYLKTTHKADQTQMKQMERKSNIIEAILKHQKQRPEANWRQILILSHDPNIITTYGLTLREQKIRAFHTTRLDEITSWIDNQTTNDSDLITILMDGKMAASEIFSIKSFIEENYPHIQLILIEATELSMNTNIAVRIKNADELNTILQPKKKRRFSLIA